MEKLKAIASFRICNLLFAMIFILGIIFTFIIPPFQKPDESTHFLRAVALADGQFICTTNKDGELSFLIEEKYLSYMDTVGLNRIATKYNEKFHPDILFSSEISNNNNSQIEWTNFCNLPSFSYIVQAIAILIGNIFNSITVSFYLGRFLCFLIFFICLIWSYRKISFSRWKWVIIAYGLIPMVTHQVSSFGYDWLHLTMIPIIFSLNIYIEEKDIVTKKNIISYIVSMLIFLLAKQGYYTFALLFFLIPMKKITRSKTKYTFLSLIYIILCILIVILYLKIGNTGDNIIDSTISNKLDNIKNPYYLFIVIKNTLQTNLDFYISSFFGYFGWLDYNLPNIISTIYMIIFVLLGTKLSNTKLIKGLNWKDISLISVSLLLSAGMIWGSMYLYWTKLGSIVIDGVQGRYLLSFTPYLLIIIAWITKQFRKRKLCKILIISIILLFILTEILYAIYKRYYDYL